MYVIVNNGSEHETWLTLLFPRLHNLHIDAFIQTKATKDVKNHNFILRSHVQMYNLSNFSSCSKKSSGLLLFVQQLFGGGIYSYMSGAMLGFRVLEKENRHTPYLQRPYSTARGQLLI